jgi:hypothetical protein
VIWRRGNPDVQQILFRSALVMGGRSEV